MLFLQRDKTYKFFKCQVKLLYDKMLFGALALSKDILGGPCGTSPATCKPFLLSGLSSLPQKPAADFF
jgi:hypothetical protein